MLSSLFESGTTIQFTDLLFVYHCLISFRIISCIYPYAAKCLY